MHTVNVHVSYHEPTGMVNITQILNLFDTKIVQEALEQFETHSLREIRGSPQWDGYYIHQSALGEILSRLSLPMKHCSWDKKKQCHAIDQFFGQEHTVSIATSEMIGLILFNQQDQKITWAGRTLTVEHVMKECQDHGLLVGRDALIQIVSDSGRNSILFYSDDDIMNLFDQSDESDFPIEATSHNSFQSQDTVRFQPKKTNKKGKSDVPILPLPRQAPLRDEVTPVEKVQEWVAAGPDIRATRFTSLKSRGMQ
jgi:hypothetical protein